MTPEQFLSSLDVSRETLERFQTYEKALLKWNPKINLVSKSTLEDLWERHFLDSAQVFDLAPNGTHWADLGTGGGFPGVVVAILAAEKRPELKVTCVESDVRKATFLRTVLRETGVVGEVISERIEAIRPLEADVVSARALAPLRLLLQFAERHLKSGGVALFPKGADHEKELEEALETWSFQVDKTISQTNPEAVILKLGDIERA